MKVGTIEHHIHLQKIYTFKSSVISQSLTIQNKQPHTYKRKEQNWGRKVLFSVSAWLFCMVKFCKMKGLLKVYDLILIVW